MPEPPHRATSTGMGLERIAAIMQHGLQLQATSCAPSSVWARPFAGVRFTTESATTDKSLRIVADHSRAVTFMIGDGILPLNGAAATSLRRLLPSRRPPHGRQGQFSPPPTVTRAFLGDTYPSSTEALIDGIINFAEEGAQRNPRQRLKAAQGRALSHGRGRPLEQGRLHCTTPTAPSTSRARLLARPVLRRPDLRAAMEGEVAKRARAATNRRTGQRPAAFQFALSDNLPRLSSTATIATLWLRVVAIVRDGESVQEKAATGDQS